MIDAYCTKCYYRVFLPALGFGCEYICVTGKRRPCPSGEGCTVRIIKSRTGTKNAEERRDVLFAEDEGIDYVQLKAERRERRLARKREYNRVYAQTHKGTTHPRKEKKLGAYDRKKITAERTRAFWQGRQAAAIKGWKEENGVSYEKMAELCGVEPSTIYKWVGEENNANWAKLEALGIQRPEVGTIDRQQNINKNDSGGLDG